MAKPPAKVIPIAKAPAEVPAHALLSPSASDRWINCPGSIAAGSLVESKPSSGFAAEGTAAHSVLEMCLRLDQDPDKFIGQEIEKGYTVTEEMAHAVGHALDFVREEMRLNPALRLHIEARVKPGHLIGLHNGELEGTADIILEDGRMCITADYKHGQGIYVEVKDNSQLKLYAAGARERNGKPFFKYRNVIIQPRNYSNNGRAVREQTITETDLVYWLQKTVRPSAHAALTPNAPRNAGAWCRWCPATGTCRVYARHAANAAAKEFGPVDPTEGPIVKEQLSNPDNMTPEQLSAALKNLPLLEGWMKAVKNQAFDTLKTGKPLPGWKLGYGAKHRVWKDNIQAKVLAAFAKIGIKREELFTVPEFLTPPQVEKLLKEKSLWPAKPRNADRPPTPLDPFFQFSMPEPKVVPAEHVEDRVTRAKEAAHEFKPTSKKAA